MVGCGIFVYSKCGNSFCSQVKGIPCFVPRDQPDTYTTHSRGITKVGKDVQVQLSTFHQHCPHPSTFLECDEEPFAFPNGHQDLLSSEGTEWGCAHLCVRTHHCCWPQPCRTQADCTDSAEEMGWGAYM